MRKGILAIGIIGATALAFVVWDRSERPTGSRLRNTSGPIAIAAVGDVLFDDPLPPDTADTRIGELLQSAAVALANLEVSLFDSAPATTSAAREGRSRVAGADGAAALARLGINVATRANNHAADLGMNGIESTTRILTAAGLSTTGAGADLDAARAPAYVGAAPRRVAVVAVTTSATPESRAAPARPGIGGRPGVHVLRYQAEIIVNSQTFDTLRQSPLSTAGSDENDLRMPGARIRRGSQTAVEFRAIPEDLAAVVEQIRHARSQADVVVLAVHSHEPSNRSQSPADLVTVLARAAIDAGATIVIGHGPHQLRGIEIYKQRPIVYSLGNFIFHNQPGAEVADLFDSGVELFQRAAGLETKPATLAYDDDVWWESVIAVAEVDRGVPIRLRLYPIDLGVAASKRARGAPRMADPATAARILERLQALSAGFGTAIQIKAGVGVIDLIEQRKETARGIDERYSPVPF